MDRRAGVALFQLRRWRGIFVGRTEAMLTPLVFGEQITYFDLSMRAPVHYHFFVQQGVSCRVPFSDTGIVSTLAAADIFGKL
jgi:hypothetical protein